MPSLSSLVPNDRPFDALLDDEGGHAARPGVHVGLRVDDQRVGVAAVRDPHLRAVEHVAVALEVGPQLHADDVGAGVRLAHRQRADMLAADQLRQVLRLLRLAAVAVDLVDAQVRVRAVREADRGRGARDLLHRDDVRQVAEVAAAVLLLHRHAVQAERRRASSTGRRETGCRGRSRRHAARSRRRRTAARCRAACRSSRRGRSRGREGGAWQLS